MRSLLAIVIIIIIYGSLYPFNFVWVDFSSIAWLDWGLNIQQRTTNGDILSNFLTFLPLGYLAYASFESRDISLTKVVAILVVAFVFAYLLQIAQFYLPSRVPTVGDALVNWLGTLSGILLAISVQSWLKRNPQVALQWPQQVSVPLLMVGCWLLYQFFPFALEFTGQSLQHSVAPLWQSIRFTMHDYVFLSVMWYCFLLFATSNQWFQINLKNASILIAIIFGLKIIIAHNQIDLSNFVAALTAIILFVQIKSPNWNKPLMTMIVVGISVNELFPLIVKLNTHTVNWIPFSFNLSGSMWVNTQVFLEKIFAYGCLIFCAKQVLLRFSSAIFFSMGIVALIEISQIWISFGVGDITDILMIAIIGYTFRQFSQAKFI